MVLLLYSYTPIILIYIVMVTIPFEASKKITAGLARVRRALLLGGSLAQRGLDGLVDCWTVYALYT